jgi:hypothetical protein
MLRCTRDISEDFCKIMVLSSKLKEEIGFRIYIVFQKRGRAKIEINISFISIATPKIRPAGSNCRKKYQGGDRHLNIAAGDIDILIMQYGHF